MAAKDIFYVHVPSSGGTTFWSVMAAEYGNGRRKRVASSTGELENVLLMPFAARRYRDISGLGGHMPTYFARTRFPDRHLVTIIRDPIEQCISRYRRFIRSGYWTVEGEMGEADLIRFARQSTADGTIPIFLDPTRKREAPVDEIVEFWSAPTHTVGLTERYNETLMLFANELGWKQAPDYERRNIGGNQTVEVSDEGKAQLIETCERDYAIYEALSRVFDARLAAMAPEALATGLADLEERVANRAAQATKSYVRTGSLGKKKPPLALPLKRRAVSLIWGHDTPLGVKRA